jgi:hypothetical protein
MTPQSQSNELPEPSAELILLMALVQAHCKSLGRKDRSRFLSEVSIALTLQEESYGSLRFRPANEDADVLRSMHRARVWWRHALGAILRLTG